MTAPTKRKRGRPRLPIRHGTEGGYQQHRRNGPPIDDADTCGCRRANNRETQRRKLARKARRLAEQPPAPPAPAPAARVLSTVEQTAADYVRSHALDEADAELLLDVLGLVAP